MTAGTLTLNDTAASTNSILGGIGDGYFITQAGNGLPAGTVHMRSVDSIATSVDSYTLTNTFPDAYCYNNYGACYILTSAGNPTSTTTRTLHSITQAAGVLSVASVGSFTMATGAATLDGAFLDSSNTQALVYYGGTTTVSAVNTGTGALDWTAALTGHTIIPVACMGSDRFLVRCSTHGNYELWNGSTATLLDSIAQDPARAANAAFVPISATSCLYAIVVDATDPMVLRYGLLSTASDTLSWTWGPTDTTTVWSPATGAGCVASAWGTNAALAPSRRVYSGGYLSMPMYAVDVTDGSIAQGAAGTAIGRGVYDNEFAWASSTQLVAHDYDLYALMTSWTYMPPATTAAATHLRQRQSPVRTPSRVRPVDLRARQTPYITK